MVQITSDIELSGAGCTTAITPNQLVQSSSENDTIYTWHLTSG
ncbi:NTP-binding protein (plasmid) [Escherichia coli]|nr:NTP-binding protein [Klebsiella pneumoniae]WOU80201.1 NTP-binding protein [Klebsiella pneumoniae]